MAVIWSEKADAILAAGRFLENVGVQNWALTHDQALLALDQFKGEAITVLGGDVYQELVGVLQSNYDNWYCDRQPAETDHAFVSRSIEKARAYIANYQSAHAGECSFVLVPES